MKTKHIILSVMVVFALATAVIINACKKDVSSESIVLSEGENQNDDFTESILAFIENCKNHPQTLGLKSTDSITIDSAVKNLEASMNLMYTFYVKTSELHKSTSEVTISVGSNGKMNEADIAQAMEDIEDALHDDFDYVSYSNKRMIAVMLDYEKDNNEHKIIINSVTGNTLIGTLYPTRDWVFGEGYGTCDDYVPQIGNTDAGEQIEIYVDDYYFESPPTGCHYYWPYPQSVEHLLTPANPSALYEYINSNDPDAEDNHLDYKIFYNHSNYPNYYYKRCLLSNDEIPFYKIQYLGYVDLALNPTNYKFKDINIKGREYADYNGVDDFMRHELYIYVGIRWVACLPAYPQNP
jgi:hypothetical protein